MTPENISQSDVTRPDPVQRPCSSRPALTSGPLSALSQSSAGPPRPWVGIILTSTTGVYLPQYRVLLLYRQSLPAF